MKASKLDRKSASSHLASSQRKYLSPVSFPGPVANSDTAASRHLALRAPELLLTQAGWLCSLSSHYKNLLVSVVFVAKKPSSLTASPMPEETVCL